MLTRLSGGAQVTLLARNEGEYVIFDGRERGVVTEVPARTGQPRKLALAPGSYVVQLRSPAALRVARIDLVAGDDRVLMEHQMQEVPLLRLARKGSLGTWRVTVMAGQQSSGLGPRGQVLGAIGTEWDGERWLSGVEVAVSAGEEVHGGLKTHDALLQASGALLYSLHFGAAAIRLGPAAGVAVLRQATVAQPTASALGATLGARVRADVQVTHSLGLYAQADGRVLLVRNTAGSDALPWAAWGLGLRLDL